MKSSVRVKVNCGSKKAGDALRSVLAPDNEGAPRGLKLELGGVGAEVMFEAAVESPSTAISTCLAVLRDVRLFQEVWLLTTAPDA